MNNKEQKKFMKMAINLAKKSDEKILPNPKVGAVIVKNNKVIGQGYHQIYGEAHAEINALKSCKVSTKGASLFVNLEPCSSFGQTPPCTQTIIESGIKNVFIGCLDLNPKHHGKSIELLQQNNITVKYNILAQKCYDLNKGFFKSILTNTPYVLLKMAMSLDGKIADFQGKSQWISGKKSRKIVQDLRKQSQAIMVAGETIRLDNPSLDIKNTPHKNLKKFVLSRNLKNTENFKVFSDKNTKICQINNKKDWKTLLKSMNDDGIQTLMLEGGGQLANNALFHKIVDEIQLFIAPKLILGGKSRPITNGKEHLHLKECLRIKKLKTTYSGSDILIKAQISKFASYPYKK